MKKNPTAARYTQNLPTTEIRQRINEANVTPKVHDKVLVTRADGTQYLAEILEIHADIKDWILKVKKVDDGQTTVEEVATLVVDAVIIVKNIILSDVFKAFSQWLKNLFRKKNK